MNDEKQIQREKVLWTITAVLAMVFVMSGYVKLVGMDPMPANYAKWGYPQWFLYVVGMIELSGGLVLLVRKITSLAALALGGVMVGAFMTHLVAGEWAQMAVPAVLFGLLYFIGYARRETVIEMFGIHKLGEVHHHAK